MDGSTSRRYDLDALRVLAVLLLIPFHSARAFDSFETFYVKNGQTSEGLSWAVVQFLNPWHMPLLFVLAGAATWLAMRHRSAGQYRTERAKRLLIPFLFGVLVIVPPQAFLALLHRGRDVAVGPFLADYWTVEGDFSGYTGSFTPAHLWFIMFLFVFSLVALPLFRRWRGREVHARWLLFAMPVILMLSNDLPSPNDGPQNPFYALALFVGGYLLMADPRAERAIHRHWRSLLVVAVGTMTTVMWIWITGTDRTWVDGSLADSSFALLRQVNAWVWVLALVGAGHAFLRRPIRGLAYASEASYPAYLLHQTVIVAVAFFVVDLNLGLWPKYALVATLSLALTLAVYEVAVRRTNITRFLFGMKPLRRAASGEQLEPASRKRPEDVEVAAIQGEHLAGPVAIGEDHNGRVRDADGLVAVPSDH